MESLPAHGQCSIFTNKLIAYLREQDGTVTDEQLGAVIDMKCDVQGKGYNYVLSACKQLEKEGMVWCRIRGAKALKRLHDNGELRELVQSSRKHVSRTMKRAIVRADAIDISVMAPDERSRHVAEAAQLGALAWLSSDGARKQLSARHAAAEVDPKRLLAALIES